MCTHVCGGGDGRGNADPEGKLPGNHPSSCFPLALKIHDKREQTFFLLGCLGAISQDKNDARHSTKQKEWSQHPLLSARLQLGSHSSTESLLLLWVEGKLSTLQLFGLFCIPRLSP